MRSPRDTTRYAGRIDTSAADAQRGADPEVYRGGVVDGSTTLDWLENVASGDMTSEAAGDIVRALDQMRGRIGGNDRRVHAAISEALAESSRNPRSAACAALRRIQSIAPSTSRARQVERTMMLAC